VNENLLQRIWARSSACLVVSTFAFLLGGAGIVGAIAEDYGRDPQVWLVIGLSALGVGLLALGVTTWIRALGLVASQVRARRSAAGSAPS
jgi:hypothetical protein